MKISELPELVKVKAINYQIDTNNRDFSKTTNLLSDAFDWDKTKEGFEYWKKLFNKKPNKKIIDFPEIIKEEPKHYDNSKGSLYQFCDNQELNTYEFDIIKRVMRCRKKGTFIEDLEKTKFLIDLYIKEHENK
tara:strand:+ start:1009 stop:1407 length:399 start_codon:yes stop_codon:yes gene_type:complete